MKLPCKVIEDLLPLYQDGVCSEESRKLVEEHLLECADCRAVLDEIRGTLSVPAVPLNDAEPLKKIRSEWIRIRKRSLLNGIFGTLSAMMILFGGWYGLTQLRIFPVPIEKVELSKVSELSDGTIAFHLYINDGKALNVLAAQADYENGVAYITPKRALIESGYPITLTIGNDRYYYVEREPFTRDQLRDPAYETELSAWAESGGSNGKADFYFFAEIRKICIGTKDDHVLLWEDGIQLPIAENSVEERYQNGIR